MRRRALTLLIADLAAALVLAGAACAGASADVSFTPCAQDPAFSCATVPVPLDRSGALPGTIGLSVERRAAPGGPSSVAVVPLAGGPGQATLPLARFIAEAIAPALGTRDLLLFDQRGTGASGALSCAALSPVELARASSLGEVIERCARQIGPARGAYTTRETVADIEAIRRAAGYEKLVLYGTSYGTKAALEYAARYPQNVAALILDSTETPNGPEPFHVSTFKAVGPALRELCSGGACARITRAPLTELARLVAGSRMRPLSGVAYDGRGKRVREVINDRVLFGLLLDGDLNPAMRAEIPGAVHSALARDPAPLARMVALNNLQQPHEEVASQVDETLFLATSCEETPFPWQRSAPQATRAAEAEAALSALPRSDFYPFNPESALLDLTIPLCVAWPNASPAPVATAAEPNVPTLILSGGQDLRTPTANALAVARLIPDARLLRVPYTGHSVIGSDLSGCAQAALTAFFASAPVSSCAAAKNRFPPAPLAPMRLAALAPTRGLAGQRGRTLTAVVDTLLDVRRTVTELALNFGELPSGVPFGGLRGGTVEVSKAGVRLRRLSYVPGVTLTGLIPATLLFKNRGPSARVTVGGRAAAAGQVRIAAGGRVSGVLAGRPFHANVAARVRVARAGGALPSSTAPTALPIPPLARLR